MGGKQALASELKCEASVKLAYYHGSTATTTTTTSTNLRKVTLNNARNNYNTNHCPATSNYPDVHTGKGENRSAKSFLFPHIRCFICSIASPQQVLHSS